MTVARGAARMKNGKCPKCGSDRVFHGVEIPAKFGPFGSNSIPITLFSIAALDNYVCAACGYVESYVAETAKRQEIEKRWPRVKDETAA
jgi:predicted nucleic-acid-binding Zn-ribbon protein